MLEPTLTNMRVLSKVKPQDKISVQNNALFISPPLWSRPIRRALSGNGRNASLETMQSTVGAAIELTNTLMNSVNYAPDTPVSERQKQKDHCSLKNMFETMNHALIGLENLKKSYTDDPSYIAALEGLTTSISDQNEVVRSFMESEHED